MTTLLSQWCVMVSRPSPKQSCSCLPGRCMLCPEPRCTRHSSSDQKAFASSKRNFTNVEMRKLANLPAHVFSWLQGTPSTQVDMSWLYDFKSPLLRNHTVHTRMNPGIRWTIITHSAWRTSWNPEMMILLLLPRYDRRDGADSGCL
jgi:hypothetical protein